MLYFPTIGIERLRMGRDGAGVTTLVAAYGCPLRCKYCLNPMCFEETFKPKRYTPQELLEMLRIDDLYFQATGGGVMFGGGEPLLYADFIHEFRKIAPKEWKLSVETSLQVKKESLALVIEDIDYYLIDCKDMNAQIYQSYTGKDQTKFLDNLQFLGEHVETFKVTVRVPRIMDYNQTSDVKRSVAKLQEMGFSNLDLFTYDVTAGEKKIKALKEKKNGR